MAAGDTLIPILPGDFDFPTSNNATYGVVNARPYIAFDADTQQSAYANEILPRNYSGNGITVTIHFMMASAVTGAVRWSAQFERMSDGALDLDTGSGFATAQAATSGTVPATAGVATSTSIAFTNGAQIDSLAAGDAFRIQIDRVAADAADTATGAARVIAVEIRETP